MLKRSKSIVGDMIMAVRYLPFSKKVVIIPFLLCAMFLYMLGKVLHMTYKQISVVFNLWLQGALLLLSGLLPLVVCIFVLTQNYTYNGIASSLAFAGYASIYITGFIVLLRHYNLPMDDAFDLCVKDLEWIANKWHMSYHAVNLIIFVVWWLTLIATNVLMSYCTEQFLFV